MEERAVISVIQYLGPLLASEVELLRGVRKEMVSIKDELECIHSFLKDAKSRAKIGDEGVKIWVKQVRQVAYRIQDVIDEHILLVSPNQPRLFGSLHKVTRTITKLKPRHEIASHIQDIKTTIGCYFCLFSEFGVYLEFLHRVADLTLVPSAALAKELEGARITASNKIRLWNKGVDSESFHPKYRSQEMRIRLSNGEPERPLIVHVG
ncbi:Sulfoquinovosyl transferase SQD2 [Camellia lanceoleosa]|uniref:Sulfoquinovosyl transferase SQD2 n=1 Tax=Camellia lanceoleosa TaxID=1840588 RepID=A0ACC0HCY8_9ERIC|nr:Sulfoquinovosyl transferase SQD2 [Camellia lanceoleosa]